jgi:hypothetical protein
VAVVTGYARSATGLGVTLGPLVVLEPAVWLSTLLALGAALFTVYSVQSVARHSQRIELDQFGIEARGLFGTTITWDSLRSMQVNYYSTRRDGTDGWTEIVVRSARGKIRIESTLVGFPELAARIAREALQRDCRLDDRSRTNLAAIGVELGHDTAVNIDAANHVRHA